MITVEKKGQGFWICGSPTELKRFVEAWPEQYPLSTPKKNCYVAGSKRKIDIEQALDIAGIPVRWIDQGETKEEEKKTEKKRSPSTKTSKKRERPSLGGKVTSSKKKRAREEEEKKEMSIKQVVGKLPKSFLTRFAWTRLKLSKTLKEQTSKPVSQLRSDILEELASRGEAAATTLQNQLRKEYEQRVEEKTTRTEIKHEEKEKEAKREAEVEENARQLVKDTREFYPVGSTIPVVLRFLVAEYYRPGSGTQLYRQYETKQDEATVDSYFALPKSSPHDTILTVRFADDDPEPRIRGRMITYKPSTVNGKVWESTSKVGYIEIPEKKYHYRELGTLPEVKKWPPGLKETVGEYLRPRYTRHAIRKSSQIRSSYQTRLKNHRQNRYGVSIQTVSNEACDRRWRNKVDAALRRSHGVSSGHQSGGGCGCDGPEYFFEFPHLDGAIRFSRFVQDDPVVCFATLTQSEENITTRLKDVAKTCHQNIPRVTPRDWENSGLIFRLVS